MTNPERYQAAFAHVRAPEGAARRVLERPKTPEIKAPPPRRRLPLRVAVIAAIVLALLAGSAGAEIASGEVSNLLAPLYGGAQTELVDSIGYPVDASATVNGYTLTADAVIGDQHHLAIVYTLTRDDGEPIPEGVYFREHENSVTRWGTGGGSGSQSREGLPANQIQMVETWGGNIPLLGRLCKVTFQDLVIRGEEDHSYEMVAEGTWELSFALRYRDTTVKVPADDLMVTGTEGNEYEIQKIQISSIGVYIDVVAPNTLTGDPLSSLLPDFEFLLRLTDGTIVTPNSAGRSGGGSVDAATVKAHYECEFKVPVPLEDMEAMILCDTEIPLDLS